MKTTQHGSYLTQITQFPYFFPINFYLVREAVGHGPVLEQPLEVMDAVIMQSQKQMNAYGTKILA